LSKAKLGAKENGIAHVEMDEATKVKAEGRFFSFYQLHMEPDPDAQGPASFN